MKYTLLFKRLDDRGSDATTTLRLEVERDGWPERIADFAGGSGCLSDGYNPRDCQLDVVTDQGFFGAALLYTESRKLVNIESCDTPLRTGGLLELKGDQCSYQIMKLSSGQR